jgi:hypothetical protein
VLSQVGIDQWKEQTSIEELGNEDTIGNGGKTLTIGILSYPGNGSNDDFLQNGVESNNNSCDRQREETSHLLVREEFLANWNFGSIFI